MKAAKDRKIPWFNPDLPIDVYNWQALQYLLSRCRPEVNGCLVYTGFVREKPRNYGDTSYRGVKWRTHRLAYFLSKGEIPQDKVVMHSCDNPPCCNPAHLKLGTHKENMAECRAKNRNYYGSRTFCKRGHEFTPENTRRSPSSNSRGCKACQRLAQRKRYQANKETALARNREYRRQRRMRLSVPSPVTVAGKP